jgi:hypothetical protein
MRAEPGDRLVIERHRTGQYETDGEMAWALRFRCRRRRSPKGKSSGQRLEEPPSPRCSSFEGKVLVVHRCHSKYTVTWGNRNYTLVITTRHFAPYSVLSRNIRGTRGTNRDHLCTMTVRNRS